MCREYDHFARDCPNSREERDLEQLQHMLNMEEQDHRSPSIQHRRRLQKSFKLMNGRNDTATFLPLDFMIGGQSRDSHPTVRQYLTRDQARYVYKKVETGGMINTDTVQQEIEQEKQLSRMDDDSGELNPYRELVVNNAEKVEMPKTQMEQWSILSNLLNYMQHSKFNSMNHSLSVKLVNRYKTKSNEEREFREVDFSTVLQSLQDEHLDVYDGIQSDIVSSSRFDENSRHKYDILR